jgi:biotin carboxylase
MFAGGDMQILSAKIAKKNNYNLFVTDKNKNAPCRFIADKFYDVDVVDIKKNYQIIKKLNFNISGVFTIASDCHLTVNKIAKRLNLHHTPIKISEICKNKIKTRKFLKKFLIQPKSFLIKDYSQYKKKVKDLNCAYVIKHLNLSGSKGFRSFDKNFIMSNSFFNQIKKLLRKLGLRLGYDRLIGCHILKLDIFFSNKGPIILEMTPRFSGGYDSTGSSFKRGLKLSEAMFKICKGEKFNKADLSYYFKANKLKVLVLSRYLFGKRLFYLNAPHANNKRNINKIFNKIK